MAFAGPRMDLFTFTNKALWLKHGALAFCGLCATLHTAEKLNGSDPAVDRGMAGFDSLAWR